MVIVTNGMATLSITLVIPSDLFSEIMDLNRFMKYFQWLGTPFISATYHYQNHMKYLNICALFKDVYHRPVGSQYH